MHAFYCLLIWIVLFFLLYLYLPPIKYLLHLWYQILIKTLQCLIMIVVNQNLIQKSFLVFIEIESIQKSEKLENGFSEFQSLVYSSGVQVIDFVKFKQKNPIANNFISAGHLEKIKNKVSLHPVELIIVNHVLTASQTRNLEKFFNKRVIDKTELILDIFATRASSHIGKLQVELAQLKHLSTRLIRGWTHLERQKGGIGLRGPGETQLETDRRLIGKRIKRLNGRPSI